MYPDHSKIPPENPHLFSHLWLGHTCKPWAKKVKRERGGKGGEGESGRGYKERETMLDDKKRMSRFKEVVHRR